MPQANDFERQWLEKFSHCLEKNTGADIRNQVMRGSLLDQETSEGSTACSEDVIAWTRSALQRLHVLAGEEETRKVMTGCACEYPKEDLSGIRQAYAAGGGLYGAHAMLQEKFEKFLRDGLKLEDELIRQILASGMGLAGIIADDHTIIATKIPKSNYLVEYFRESDSEKRRQYYCHCPRIREVLKSDGGLDPVYCYCGAGFYKLIWEEILGRPVHVEVLESVLQGDEVCKVAIHL